MSHGTTYNETDCYIARGKFLTKQFAVKFATRFRKKILREYVPCNVTLSLPCIVALYHMEDPSFQTH